LASTFIIKRFHYRRNEERKAFLAKLKVKDEAAKPARKPQLGKKRSSSVRSRSTEEPRKSSRKRSKPERFGNIWSSDERAFVKHLVGPVEPDRGSIASASPEDASVSVKQSELALSPLHVMPPSAEKYTSVPDHDYAKGQDEDKGMVVPLETCGLTHARMGTSSCTFSSVVVYKDSLTLVGYPAHTRMNVIHRKDILRAQVHFGCSSALFLDLTKEAFDLLHLDFCGSRKSYWFNLDARRLCTRIELKLHYVDVRTIETFLGDNLCELSDAALGDVIEECACITTEYEDNVISSHVNH